MDSGSQSVQNSLKRPLDEETPTFSTPTKTGATSEASTPLTVVSSIATPSPLKRATPPQHPQASVAPTSSAPNGSLPPAPVGSTQPAKRRKFTEKEKEEMRLEKEAKDKARAEQKARKEEEKRAKEEEKKKKNEEREEKKRAKEIEQQQRDEEKRKREEEKQKKERSQMKLNAFFVKPKPTGGSSGTTVVAPIQNTTPHSISLAPDVPMQDADPVPVSTQVTIPQRAKNEYERFFLPFELPSHSILAPYNRYMEDPAKLASTQARLEKVLAGEDVAMDPVNLNTFKSRFPRYESRGRPMPSVVDIVERINSSSDHPIDLTGDSNAQDPLALLKRIPMKYLHFPEDVRPPYYGTYTKPHTPRQQAKLARNPFSRILVDTNYDYDSEAEWEEPEEGEDLDSDGEEDLDEEGEDDLEGFLDDEEEGQVKRRLISGDLEPVSTGLCWEGTDGVSRLNDGSGAISTEFKEFQMCFLLEPQPRAINPFSTSYWAPTPVPAIALTTSGAKENSAMQPPRLPLINRPMNSMLNSLNGGPNATPTATGNAAKPPKRQIPAEYLPEFKAQVAGSDLTKIALIEALKKKFPKLPKDAISNTLSAVAARVGPKEVEKRWVLL